MSGALEAQHGGTRRSMTGHHLEAELLPLELEIPQVRWREYFDEVLLHSASSRHQDIDHLILRQELERLPHPCGSLRAIPFAVRLFHALMATASTHAVHVSRQGGREGGSPPT